MIKRKESNDIQTSLRLPTSLLKRMDAIADMTDGPRDPRWAAVEGTGPPLNRSDVLRLALERGLNILAERVEKEKGQDMKIAGTQTEVKSVSIDVSPRDLFDAFLSHLAEKLFPDKEFRPYIKDRYSLLINDEGFWEAWEDGHGSGYTTTKREATNEEVVAMKTWNDARSLRIHFTS